MEVESRGRSDTALMTQEGALAATSSSAAGPYIQGPVVGNLSVSDKSSVHLGPKVYKVTQHVTHKEVVRGRLMKLDLESSRPRTKCRCSVIVFVCWASLVACALGALLFYFLLPRPKRLDIGLHEAWYLRRDDWQAMAPYFVTFLQLPLRHVVVGHSATTPCYTRYQCIKNVLAIQQDNLRRDMDDIVPNYLIGGGGLVFEGRGANVQGAMVYPWNRKSISVMFIGDYNIDKPDDEQLAHFQVLLDLLQKEGVLTSDYDIRGKCQIQTETYSPGGNVMTKIKDFPKWDPRNASYCLKVKTI